MTTKKKKRYRNKSLLIMVTENEKQQIKKNMLKVGASNLSEFGRLLMLYGAVYNIDVTKLSDLAYEINRVGNNINQIAKKANETGNVYKTELDEINEKLGKLNDYVDSLYQKNNMINGRD